MLITISLVVDMMKLFMTHPHFSIIHVDYILQDVYPSTHDDWKLFVDYLALTLFRTYHWCAPFVAKNVP